MFRLTEIKLPFKAYLMPLESESRGSADEQGAESLEDRPLTVTRTVRPKLTSAKKGGRGHTREVLPACLFPSIF